MDHQSAFIRPLQHGQSHGRQKPSSPQKKGPRGPWVVRGFDLVAANLEHRLRATGSPSAADAKRGGRGHRDRRHRMLPAGKHVLAVYDDIVPAAAKGTLFIDSSTIDVDPRGARRMPSPHRAPCMLSIDAPVSGGVGGAEAGTLTFMAGGSAESFARAETVP